MSIASLSLNSSAAPSQGGPSVQPAWEEQMEVTQTSTGPLHSGRAVLNVSGARFRVAQKSCLRQVGEKDIIQDVSVSVKSGETLAIMGPSGAGKTTFLDFLTMEGSGGNRTGNVNINMQPLTPEVFRRCCAYVPQYDKGWAFLTCRESLRFAADFYLKDPKADKCKRVDQLLKSMGLESCADTLVGGEFIKGLSGGQRRRLSLAMAMLKDPLAVFLDEVTSGLDAASAAGIASFLQELARSQDIIIVCTIHQPSAKVFSGFHNLLLLSGGSVAYSGKLKNAKGYFARLGYEIPEQENPADFFLDSVNADFSDRARVEEVLQSWKDCVPMERVRSGSYVFADLDLGRPQNWFVEVWVLFRRSLTLARRDPTVYVSRVVALLAAEIFFTIVYFESRERTQAQAYNRFWLIIWHMGVPANLSVAACLGQNMEFESVRREVKAGMYRVSSYLAAQHLIQVPYMFLLALSVIGVSGYGIASWNPDSFWAVLLVEALFLFSFECAAQMFGVMFKHPLLGLLQVTSLWFASFLFGGFLVPQDDVPMPLRLLAYASPIKWGSKAVVYAEYAGTEFEGAVLDPSDPRGFSCPQLAPGDPECYGRTGHQVLNTLRQTSVKHLETEDHLLLDCCMLLAVAAFFRLNYFFLTWLRCRSGRTVMPPPQPSESPRAAAIEQEPAV